MGYTSVITYTLEDGQEAQAYVMPKKPWFARRLGNRWVAKG